MTISGLEGLSQHKQNFEKDNPTSTKELECPTDLKKPFASIPTEVFAYVSKKTHAKKIGDLELRKTSIEMISTLEEGLDQPKELKPEHQVSKNLIIQLDGKILQYDPCLSLASQDVVLIEVSGKAI